MKRKQLPSQESLSRLFVYEPKTGVLLRRLKRGRLSPCNTVTKCFRADGSFKAAYTKVRVGNDIYLAHRLIYALYHGVDPGDLEVDHKDGCGLNNRIDNIRLATSSQNHANQVTKNYSWREGKNKFQVSVVFEGQTLHGGYFDSEEDAKEAAIEFKRQLYGNFVRV